MTSLLHRLPLDSAQRTPDAVALLQRDRSWSYAELAEAIERFSGGLMAVGLIPGERVAIYLPKQFETVVSLFATAAAAGVFIPVNPILKPRQVAHILRDSGARMLITARGRAELLEQELAVCHDLRCMALVDSDEAGEISGVRTFPWRDLAEIEPGTASRIDSDLAAILYTSGSTGRPKGVVLSHRNMVAGAHSVAEYLENGAEDRLLAVLPFSFDYGFSQLSTAFSVGASVALMDYLLPREVPKALARYQITGLAAVPPLWIQLAQLEWPEGIADHLRYLTNSGGALPREVSRRLQEQLPKTRIYLMYGLTEAFRSTYLPPEQIEERPNSMGRAIPNAEILVVRPDGSPCAPGEPGELVHRGALVAQGYWNDAEKTAQRFRPTPGHDPAIPLQEIALFSGDTVTRDEEGYLYFVGRMDEMIKSSGYRISPTEIEETLYASGLVAEAVALGLPHPSLGQGIVVVLKPVGNPFDTEALLERCRRDLPGFMVPLSVVIREELPRNPNGKIDRRGLVESLDGYFDQ